MRRHVLVAFLASFAIAAAGCGSTASPVPPAGASQAPVVTPSAPGASTAAACAEVAEADITTPSVAATIKDFAFTPEPVKAKVDEVIAWTNNDSTAHTASLVDGSCGTQNIAGGAEGALVFHVAGTYPYRCNIHNSMKGTIEVE
jgi:plastocyanin